MLPPLHTPTPILDASAKLGGGPGLVPATRLPAWLPVPLPQPPPSLPAGRRLLSSEDTVPAGPLPSL